MDPSHDRAELRYRRQGNLIRFTTEGLTDHEIRTVLLGFWARLEAADRADHVRELQHYLEGWDDPAVFLPPLAAAIRDGADGPNATDLRRHVRAEHEGER